MAQALLSMELSRQEYWSGYYALLQWILPNPEIKPRFPGSQADSYCLNHQGSPLPEMVQKILIHVSENLEPQDCVLKLITA